MNRNNKKIYKEMAKLIVLHCFRNTFLEDLHAGKERGSSCRRFGDEDMKKLMIEAVDKTYTFLLCAQEESFSTGMLEWIAMSDSTIKEWNEPKIVKEWTKK